MKASSQKTTLSSAPSPGSRASSGRSPGASFRSRANNVSTRERIRDREIGGRRVGASRFFTKSSIPDELSLRAVQRLRVFDASVQHPGQGACEGGDDLLQVLEGQLAVIELAVGEAIPHDI